MIVYDRLWKTMQAKGISQYKLIKEYGISSGQLDRIRKGETAEVYSVFPDKNVELWGFIGTGYVSMEWLTKVHEVGNEEKHLRHGR